MPTDPQVDVVAPANIAEGFGRYYPGDFARFMRNALGSLHETRNHLGAGLEKQYLTENLHRELGILASRAIGACVGLTTYLESCKEQWKQDRKDRTKRRSRKRLS